MVGNVTGNSGEAGATCPAACGVWQMASQRYPHRPLSVYYLS